MNCLRSVYQCDTTHRKFSGTSPTLTWAEKNLVAGDLVQTKGRLKNGSYEKDGNTVYTTDLIATDLSKLAGAPAKKKRAAKKVAA